jgi:hypothetical protein
MNVLEVLAIFMVRDYHPDKGLFNHGRFDRVIWLSHGVLDSQVLLGLNVLKCPVIIGLDGAKLVRRSDVSHPPAQCHRNTHALLLRRAEVIVADLSEDNVLVS